MFILYCHFRYIVCDNASPPPLRMQLPEKYNLECCFLSCVSRVNYSAILSHPIVSTNLRRLKKKCMQKETNIEAHAERGARVRECLRPCLHSPKAEVSDRQVDTSVGKYWWLFDTFISHLPTTLCWWRACLCSGSIDFPPTLYSLLFLAKFNLWILSTAKQPP